MATEDTHPPGEGPGEATWKPWLAWTWVGLVVAAALAVLLGLDDLELALDFQRHLR